MSGSSNMRAVRAPHQAEESVIGFLQKPLCDDASYLSLLSRKIFHAGFSKAVVDRRWSAFETSFLGFDAARLLALDAAGRNAILNDSRLIRNRKKILAVLENAGQVQRLANTHGSFRAWLRGLHTLPYECRAEALCSTFHHVGAATAFWFLFEAGMAELHERPDEVIVRGAG